MRRITIVIDECGLDARWTVEQWTVDSEGTADRVVLAAFDHCPTDLLGEALPWKAVLRTVAGDLS